MIKNIFRAVDLLSEETLEIDKFKELGGELIKLGDDAGSAQVWRFVDGDLIFKDYSISKLKQRFRSKYKIPCPKFGHRYGWSEKINAERMDKMGFSVPKLRFYYEKQSLFFCSKQTVVFEYLNGYMTLNDKVKHSIDRLSFLELVEPFVFELSVFGVFHMDLNSKNIMLNEHKIKLIDFEYVCWDRTDTGNLYGYYFGYFFQKWLSEYIDADEYINWFKGKLSERLESFKNNNTEIVEYFNIGKDKELSRSERFKLFI